MSPLLAPPLRGYTDEQRLANYDTGSLYTHQTVNSNAIVPGPTLDVSRFAYIGGAATEALSSSVMNFQWALDAAFSQVTGNRQVILNSNIPGDAFFRLLNLGPFVGVNLNPIAGANRTQFVNVFATNRVAQLEFIPQAQTLISQQSVAIGASATVVVYPVDYYAGPVQLVLEGNVSIQPVLQFLDTSGNWDSLWVVPPIAASVWTPFTVVTPPGAWRLEVINQTAGAGLYSAIMTPPTTGAT